MNNYQMIKSEVTWCIATRGGFVVRGRAWGTGQARSDHFEKKDGKIEQSDAIWNEIRRQFGDNFEKCRACNLTLFETIWKCREKMKTMSLKHALWWYLNRFETAENFLKKMSLKHDLWPYLKRFGTLVTAERKSENNVSKACD